MDPFEHLAVKFHYGGEFLSVGGHLQYFGGSTGMSYIELDKISLPEIEGHLADHVCLYSGVRLHWLYPGMELNEGLRLLYDDNACLKIAKHITDGGVAEIYVEEFSEGEETKDKKVTDWELEIAEADDEANDDQEQMYVDVPASMSVGKVKAVKSPSKSPSKSQESSDEADVDYQPKDLNSSGDDEEAEELRKFANRVKKDIRAKKLGE